MLNDIKAVIFDLDGTLIDSMWVWEKIDVDYLSKKGFQMDSGLRDDIAHLSFEDTAVYFKSKFNIKDTVDEIMAEWHDMALEEYCNNVSLKPGAKEFLTLLKSRDIKIALATSNSATLLQIALKNNGIYDFFDSITTTNEVSRGKNFPDVYLLAAGRLGVEASECIVFEDILPAVVGAKAAGMRVVAVLDNASSHQWNDMLLAADKTIKDYTDLDKAV